MTGTMPDDLAFPAVLAEAFEVGSSWEYDEETDTATGPATLPSLAGFPALAMRHAPAAPGSVLSDVLSAAEIVGAARAEFPGFPDYMDALCR